MVVMNPIRLGSGIRNNAIVAVIALIGGFTGSAVHDRVRKASDAIQARRFEVVSASGKVLSFWGPDPDPQIPRTTPNGVLMVFMDSNGVRRCQIGSRIGDNGPELLFYGKDAPSERRQKYLPQPRFAVALGYNEDPGLVMRDGTIERILLGAVHGDAPSPSEDTWCLTLREPTSTLLRSRANVCAYRAIDGSHGAQVLIIDRDKRWTLPPEGSAR